MYLLCLSLVALLPLSVNNEERPQTENKTATHQSKGSRGAGRRGAVWQLGGGSFESGQGMTFTPNCSGWHLTWQPLSSLYVPV